MLQNFPSKQLCYLGIYPMVNSMHKVCISMAICSKLVFVSYFIIHKVELGK